FTAKDFRTWGGTLIAAIELAQHGLPENPNDAKRRIAAVMRKVGASLGNTAAVARSSYVSPAVVEQYLDGRTIDDFRPRHLRAGGPAASAGEGSDGRGPAPRVDGSGAVAEAPRLEGGPRPGAAVRVHVAARLDPGDRCADSVGEPLRALRRAPGIVGRAHEAA